MSGMDLFAEALWRYYQTGRAALRIERDDGNRSGEDLSWYFTTAREFPPYERAALEFARGRVLDLGCGAGRHALYLTRRGLKVTGVDVSERAVELARARGLDDVRVANACGKLPFRDGEFDTVVLFGNNLGICGTVPRLRRMLRELYRITSPRGRILGTTRMPSTTKPLHKKYWERNLAAGRPFGQVRLRLTFEGAQGDWFNFLFIAPTDLLQIAAKEKWKLARVLPGEDFEEGYAAVMEKK